MRVILIIIKIKYMQLLSLKEQTMKKSLEKHEENVGKFNERCMLRICGYDEHAWNADRNIKLFWKGY